MKASFKKINITPKLPVKLSGYKANRISKDILDPIYMRIFYFKNKKELLWIQFDLCTIDHTIYTYLTKKLNIPILLSASHTHSSVCGTLNTDNPPFTQLKDIFGEYNKEYVQYLCSTIEKELEVLRKEATHCLCKIHKTKINGLGTNRNDNSTGDNDVLMIELKNNTSRVLILRLACHPTVLNALNTRISADFMGYIEKYNKDYDIIACVNGSAGDISTRYTRQSSDISELERYGKLVSSYIQDIAYKGEYKELELSYDHRYFNIKTKDYVNIEPLLAKLSVLKNKPDKTRFEESVLEGIEVQLMNNEVLKTITSINLNISLLKINNQIIIFTPLELYSQLTNMIKKQYPYEFIGYTNGYYMYMCNNEAYNKQYYESYSSFFKKDEGEKLLNDIVNYIKENTLEII